MAAGTVTYRWPGVVNGTTVAPTAAQVANQVVADVAMADASTATTITHNFGVETNGTLGAPKISVCCLTAGTAPCVPVFAFTDANSVTLSNSTSAAGSGCTWRVTLERPITATR